ALGAYAGAVFLVDAEGQFLELARIAGYEASRLGPWSRFPLAADVPLAEAVRSGEAIWLEDASEYALRYPQLASTHEPRTRALACIPLSTGGRALGGLVLSFDERRPFPPEDRALILAVAGQCAQALGRARAFEAERQAREVAEAAQRRLRFLAEASRVLGSALEYETTLQTVARLALPDLADWCVVDLEQPDGTLRRVAVAHSGGAAGLEALGRAARQPIHREDPHPHAQALRTGRSMLVPAVSESLLRVMARDEEHLALLQQLALVSGIVVPLAARGRTFGVLSLARAAPHAPYTEEDLALAEELARRAAVAIDNATLYTQAERSVQEARALYRAALAIGGELELEARLERVLDATLELLEVSHAHLGLVDPERREVVIVAERGLSSAAVGGRIPSAPGSPAGSWRTTGRCGPTISGKTRATGTPTSCTRKASAPGSVCRSRMPRARLACSRRSALSKACSRTRTSVGSCRSRRSPPRPCARRGCGSNWSRRSRPATSSCPWLRTS